MIRNPLMRWPSTRCSRCHMIHQRCMYFESTVDVIGLGNEKLSGVRNELIAMWVISRNRAVHWRFSRPISIRELAVLKALGSISADDQCPSCIGPNWCEIVEDHEKPWSNFYMLAELWLFCARQFPDRKLNRGSYTPESLFLNDVFEAKRGRMWSMLTNFGWTISNLVQAHMVIRLLIWVYRPKLLLEAIEYDTVGLQYRFRLPVCMVSLSFKKVCAMLRDYWHVSEPFFDKSGNRNLTRKARNGLLAVTRTSQSHWSRWSAYIGTSKVSRVTSRRSQKCKSCWWAPYLISQEDHANPQGLFLDTRCYPHSRRCQNIIG